MALTIQKPHVLVVEGLEENRFFKVLLNHLNLQNIQIMPIGGKQKLRENLKALALSSDFSKVISLGVVRDADANPTSAFQSVRDALQDAGLPTPEHPLLPAGDKPRVCVLVLPGGDNPGMLEDLCLKASEQDPAMHCVEQYFECLQKAGLSLPDNMSKAKIQVFLASRPKAGLRLGEAAEAGYWSWDTEAFEQVRNFLQIVASQGG